ncbi:MAG: leucine-rich repeat domain-containing protein [Spirochaetaceae bacterium]|nr:leucine-rich repeat domain-containing protein [Spirochaetaceae bacterium]
MALPYIVSAVLLFFIFSLSGQEVSVSISDCLLWEVTDAGVKITKYKDNTAVLAIPDRIQGVPVTAIGDEAFYRCKTLTEVSIPASVTVIGNRAFYRCVSLTAITVAEENLQYKSSNGVLFDKNMRKLIQYPAGKSGTAYTIPPSVTAIGEYAFSECAGIAEVSIPASVTAIGYGAFYWCENLSRAVIPASVTVIGTAAFSGCWSLDAITVAEENLQYKSSNGVLFDKNMRKLIQYPAGKSGTAYTIPSSVTVIGEWAFSWCGRLDSIHIPLSVTSISDGAFLGCEGFTGVTIPSSVMTVGEWAFIYCDKLTKVTLSPKTRVGKDAFPKGSRIAYSD